MNNIDKVKQDKLKDNATNKEVIIKLNDLIETINYILELIKTRNF